MTNDRIPLNRNLVVSLMKVGNQVDVSMNKFVKHYGISLPQFNVLRILRGRKGKPANLSTINDLMIHKTSNTTRLLDRLIDKNLAQRAVCKNNRRKIEVTLTPDGDKLLREIDQVLDEKEANLLIALTNNEKEKMLQLLNRIT